ncbi:hypothetical protein AB4332_13795 [Vibrio breoganii]
MFVSLFVNLFPWRIRRLIYIYLKGYDLDKESFIGLSIIRAEQVKLSNNARIGHFTYCGPIEEIVLGCRARLGNFNWVTGCPRNNEKHFSKELERSPRLLLGDDSAITSRHFIDCTNSIKIGSFSTIAGIRSQFLTHSIDIKQSKQRSKPIIIGEYCFIGTGVTMLGGSSVASYSVVGACSLINKELTEEYSLYAGVPASKISALNKDEGYFTRIKGFIN